MEPPPWECFHFVTGQAFFLDGIVFILNLVVVERPLSAEEVALDQVDSSSEMVNSIDACKVCGVSLRVRLRRVGVGGHPSYVFSPHTQLWSPIFHTIFPCMSWLASLAHL